MKCNLIGPRRFSFFKHVRGKHPTPIQGNCKGCCKWTTLQISKKWTFFIIVFIYLQCSHFKFIARSNQESGYLKKNVCRRRSEWTFPTPVSHWFRLCGLVSISRHTRNLGNNHLNGCYWEHSRDLDDVSKNFLVLEQVPWQTTTTPTWRYLTFFGVSPHGPCSSLTR